MKVYTILTGSTLNSHITFKEQLAAKASLTEAENEEECDFILAFCPISSRAGSDIDAALQKIPDDKPAILVVMHHTYDPESIVPESNRNLTRSDIVTVDCLFHETKGLLICQRNNTAIDIVLKELNKQQDVLPESSGPSTPENFSWCKRIWNCIMMPIMFLWNIFWNICLCRCCRDDDDTVPIIKDSPAASGDGDMDAPEH
ncbi:hypothetical protein MATL_G00204120 [Megalops atlanticus]|uniref:Uncharacterized protein n=1 Tax=Megalops atlanticus TaxID=7932 RepID=A0A9D3PI15_MEGAT|nr:hypothetical protein MATL_G00204120 [Megalops atlanticus]